MITAVQTPGRRDATFSSELLHKHLFHLAALATLVALCACGGGTSTSATSDASTGSVSAPATPTAPSGSSNGNSDGGAAASEPDPQPPPASPGKAAANTAVPPGLVWRGVNLSSAEFTASVLPGTYGKQYIYPTSASTDYFKSKGMNMVRVPFLWERMQPTLNGDLDDAELARLKGFVSAANAKGMTVLIDPHNYARYRREAIGSAAVPISAFANFWSRLGGVFKGNPKVVYGLMNEPYGLASETWVSAANAAIRSIRAAGATNAITVPGNAWTGAHSWSASWYGTPNAVAMTKLSDSGNNLLIEVHQYLDSDSSGTKAECVSASIGAQRLADFTAWLRANGRRALLGEFAGADNATCKAALTNMLHYMESNSDVWAGWTYWAAGPWWGDNMFSLEPVNNADKPQMKALMPYL